MSFAGKRAGMHDGTRSGLWSYQADAVRALGPAVMVWEKVPDALSSSASSRMPLARRAERGRTLRGRGLCDCDFPEFDTPVGSNVRRRKRWCVSGWM